MAAPLQTWEEARPWAVAIKEEILALLHAALVG